MSVNNYINVKYVCGKTASEMNDHDDKATNCTQVMEKRHLFISPLKIILCTHNIKMRASMREICSATSTSKSSLGELEFLLMMLN